MNGVLLKLLSGRHVDIVKVLGLRAWWAFLGRHARVLAPVWLAGVLIVITSCCWPPARDRIVAVGHRWRLRRTWRRAARHAGVVGSEDQVPAVTKSQAVPAGDRAKVVLPHGTHAGELSARAEAIAASLGVREVRVSRDPANARVAWVTVVRRDPLAMGPPLPWPALADSSGLAGSAMSLTLPVPVGLDEDGRRVALSLVGRNVLCGGEPGGGKSNGLNMLVAAAALDPDVRLTLLDGKLVELAVWRRCAEACVGVSIAEAIDVLKSLQTEMDERYEILLSQGRRKVVPGEDGPHLHVVVCDELAHYLTAGDRKENQEAANLFRDLVSRGRAAGIVVLGATQKPSSDVIPTSLRDLFGFRWAFRCSTPQASDTILGQGWASQGYSAATIDPANRGVGLLLHEGGTPVRMRAYYLSDEDLVVLASRAEALRSGVTGGVA